MKVADLILQNQSSKNFTQEVVDLDKIHFVPFKEKQEPFPKNYDLLQAFFPYDIGVKI